MLQLTPSSKKLVTQATCLLSCSLSGCLPLVPGSEHSSKERITPIENVQEPFIGGRSPQGELVISKKFIRLLKQLELRARKESSDPSEWGTPEKVAEFNLTLKKIVAAVIRDGGNVSLHKKSGIRYYCDTRGQLNDWFSTLFKRYTKDALVKAFGAKRVGGMEVTVKSNCSKAVNS